MQPEMKARLTNVDRWIKLGLRLIFMLIFVLVVYFLQFLFWVLAAVQFLFSLFMGKPHQEILPFSEGLCFWFYHIYRFLVFNTEDKPFPFGPWPGSKKAESPKMKKAPKAEAPAPKPPSEGPKE